MSISSVLSRGREAAEARMLDFCTVVEATGARVWDPVTETYTTPGATVYAGKCRVKAAGGVEAHEADAGDGISVVVLTEVHVPADVTGLAVGQVVTVETSIFNPALVGVGLRLNNLAPSSQATAQRLVCTQIQDPA